MSDTGPNFADAIASIESGGNYGILGPATKGGDRAYGKYQVMGSNIGPWTQEILGTKLTPQQFLQSPEVQDAVFHGKFGQYVNQYGPEGAARAWFAGPRGMNNPNAKDVNGMTVEEYGRRFSSAMAPPLGTTNVGSAPPIGPPLGAPQAPQLPAASQQQPQQLPAQAASVGAPQAPQQQFAQPPPLQLLRPFRPQVNLQPLQQYMANLHPALRGFSFPG